MKNYNTTQLNPETTFERHVFHRDQFAHYLRWSHVLNMAKIGMNILDVGCGSGNLYEVFYRNRYAPQEYCGVDVRKKTIEKNREKFPRAFFQAADIVNDPLPQTVNGKGWDMIASFEVVEHIGKNNIDKFLENVKSVMNSETTFLMSTPCYDEKVGAADNHTFDSGDGRGVAVQEFNYEEMKSILESKFDIVAHYGTFASQKDYKEEMTQEEKIFFGQLSEYYDTNLLSVIFAPLHPSKSRNVIWKLTLKK